MDVKGLNEVNIFRVFGDYSKLYSLPNKLSIKCHSQGQTGCVCALVVSTPLNPHGKFSTIFSVYIEFIESIIKNK